MKPVTPTRGKYTILKQLCEHIPAYMTSTIAKDYDIESRAFSPWSHTVAMIHAHLTHAIGLNDVCDGLRNHEGMLSTLRGATAPSRNGLICDKSGQACWPVDGTELTVLRLV